MKQFDELLAEWKSEVVQQKLSQDPNVAPSETQLKLAATMADMVAGRKVKATLTGCLAAEMEFCRAQLLASRRVAQVVLTEDSFKDRTRLCDLLDVQRLEFL